MPAPRTLPYEVVDVFTGDAFAGNPLAVVLDGDDLPTAAMQLLAREFGFSETAFPVAPPAGADYGLRIFTPEVELPFAGHPSVGSAAVLHGLGRLPAGRRVQACGAGLLDVDVSAARVTVAGGPPALRGEVDPAPLLAAVGLRADDLAGTPVRAGCGIDFTYLLVREEAVGRIAPDTAALRALDLGTGLSVTAWDGARAHSRVLVPEVGVAEDPATGSAAVGLGVVLAAAGLVGDGTTAYEVAQGDEVGRPSRMACTVVVEGGRAVATTVGGSSVRVMSGRVRVPGA